MVAVPDGLIDRFAKQVIVLGWNGRFRYVFGADTANNPGSIAVSRDNLVFVSDNFMHVINVYRIQRTAGRIVRLVAKIGGVGAGQLQRYLGIVGG
jgi:hypothetical protein